MQVPAAYGQALTTGFAEEKTLRKLKHIKTYTI